MIVLCDSLNSFAHAPLAIRPISAFLRDCRRRSMGFLAATMKNLIDKKYSRLTVVSEGERVGTHRMFKCVCECGTIKKIAMRHLVALKTKSCGCLQSENAKRLFTTHGKSKTPEFESWTSMRNRCLNSKNKAYKNYGGRGVEVCDRWNKFENFIKDMGCRPYGYEIERKNNDGNYEPSNCKWATIKEQGNNRRTNVFIEFKGSRKTIAQWCDELGLNRKRVYQRLKNGFSVSDSFNPIKDIRNL